MWLHCPQYNLDIYWYTYLNAISVFDEEGKFLHAFHKLSFYALNQTLQERILETHFKKPFDEETAEYLGLNFEQAMHTLRHYGFTTNYD
jgi:hypothetical protein